MSIKTAVDKIIKYANTEPGIPLGKSRSDREELEKILLQELGQPVRADAFSGCSFCGYEKVETITRCLRCQRERRSTS